ncbi:MAG: hypothetical protein IPF54_18440 [Draconibacterium sp.]|nr:hypothetical protein [Draconibacterium sp.]
MDATATVEVTEQALPNAGTNGTLAICAGSTVTANDLFDALEGNPAINGSWTPALQVQVFILILYQLLRHVQWMQPQLKLLNRLCQMQVHTEP